MQLHLTSLGRQQLQRHPELPVTQQHRISRGRLQLGVQLLRRVEPVPVKQGIL